jgi:hypothetical protein
MIFLSERITCTIVSWTNSVLYVQVAWINIQIDLHNSQLNKVYLMLIQLCGLNWSSELRFATFSQFSRGKGACPWTPQVYMGSAPWALTSPSLGSRAVSDFWLNPCSWPWLTFDLISQFQDICKYSTPICIHRYNMASLNGKLTMELQKQMTCKL